MIVALAVPRVSVLMPCHNSARWLRPAIESVLAQSLTELELIIIDNGSTDDTVAIAEAYASQDTRISVLRQGDLGPAMARNRGRGIAKADWIATLDSDDVAEPTRLERQIGFATQNSNVILLGSGFLEIDTDGVAQAIHAYPSDDHALRRRLEHLQGFFPHSSAFYRREAVDRLGGYRIEVGHAEDWDLWLRLAEIGEIGCLSDPLVRIRKHPTQMSLDGNGRIQQVHACAASIAHLLRMSGHPDPISTESHRRDAYISWVDRQLQSRGYFEQRRVWGEARAKVLSSRRRFLGLLRFAGDLAASQYAFPLLRQKLMGSDLPARLAKAWQTDSDTSGHA